MNHENVVKNSPVGDARGGSLVIYGIRMTYDLKRQLYTSIAPVKAQKYNEARREL
jgi:hypothetical protein